MSIDAKIFFAFIVIMIGAYIADRIFAYREQKARQKLPPNGTTKHDVHAAHQAAVRRVENHGPFRTAADALNDLIRSRGGKRKP
jgi:hypothetical protein